MDLFRIAAVMLGLPEVRCRRSNHEPAGSGNTLNIRFGTNLSGLG
jgi:hypothetical protein